MFSTQMTKTRWPSLDSWRVIRTWGSLLCISAFLLLWAFQFFGWERLFVDRVASMQVAMAVLNPQLLAENADKRGATSQVWCFLPPGSSPDDVAPYLTPQMLNDWRWWVNSEGTLASGEWWLGIISEWGELRMHRIDPRLKPVMDKPICASTDKLRLRPLDKPSAQGVRFQVDVLTASRS